MPNQTPAEIIEIRDPEVDVDALMAKVRENVARRRAEGAYSEDLDAIADEVRAASLAERQPMAGAEGEGGSVAATLAELNAHWMIREVPFASNLPILGPVIVAVRNAWNWMSTKWYVRPIIQQQVGFNALVVRAFNESQADQASLVEKVRQLEAEVSVLREQIARAQALGPDTDA
jgi:O-antigen chain-terminating methyltransferase